MYAQTVDSDWPVFSEDHWNSMGQKCPSREDRNGTRICAKSWPFLAGMVINGLRLYFSYAKGDFNKVIVVIVIIINLEWR